MRKTSQQSEFPSPFQVKILISPLLVFISLLLILVLVLVLVRILLLRVLLPLLLLLILLLFLQVVIESSPVPSPAYTPVAYSTYRKIGSPLPPYSNYLADVGPRFHHC